MGGNSFGTLFKVITFGESHGRAMGCVVEGCPAGLPLTTEDIARDLEKRRPGMGGASSPRREEDQPEILSGVFEGKTLGSPIAIIIPNREQRSSDYDELKDCYRPGHADWTTEAKYGRRDHRGGGRSSARETSARVAAGAVARVFLAQYGIRIRCWTEEAAGVAAPPPGSPEFDEGEIDRNSLHMPGARAYEEALEAIEGLRSRGESAGGIARCVVRSLPPGLGEPVFEKLNALLSQAIMSIPSCRGIEFGDGFASPRFPGSEQNDAPRFPPGKLQDQEESFSSNHSGGMAGGISNGMPLEFRAAFRPIPSVGIQQKTVDREGKERDLLIGGRHDICQMPRVISVIEAMTALVLADLMLRQRSARL